VGQLKSGTGVPPVNHEQDARATIKLSHYRLDGAGTSANGRPDSPPASAANVIICFNDVRGMASLFVSLEAGNG
jgi:hypothetical protein